MATVVDINSERLETTSAVGPQLFRLLRDRIVRCELEPGVRLSEVDVAQFYGTSRQPVREAFIKLAEASLIEVRPQRGSYVRRIDIGAVMAARFVREAVEADIVRVVAERATPADLSELDTILARQSEAIENIWVRVTPAAVGSTRNRSTSVGPSPVRASTTRWVAAWP